MFGHADGSLPSAVGIRNLDMFGPDANGCGIVPGRLGVAGPVQHIDKRRNRLGIGRTHARGLAGRREGLFEAALAEFQLGEDRHKLNPGEAIDIPLGAHHALGNDTEEPVIVIEVQMGSYFGEDGYGNLNPKQKKRAVPGLEKYHKTDTFLSEAITLEAKAAIDQSLKKEKPFFLYMSHYAVHSPFNSDPRFADNYKDSKKPKNAQAYATLIEGIDKSLGDLMDHVASKGVAENTLILFVGDNGSDGPLGDTYGYFSSAPLRGKKGTCYEGGMRVPFIAGWAKAGKANPFKIARNHLHHEQIGTVMDIYSTIVDASNSSSPSKHPVDGVSLLPQLSGKNNKERPDHFMCHFPHSHRSSYFTSFRKGDWKLIYRYLTNSGKRKSKQPLPKYELYHLKNDPYETKNLAHGNTRKTNEMIRLMTEQLERENALFPVRDDLELRPQLIN